MSKLHTFILPFIVFVAGMGFLSGCSNSTNYAPSPFVKISDTLFVIDSDGYTVTELPAEYKLIGEVKKRTNSFDADNGESSCCDEGDKIFQSLKSPNEVFVYTKLFSGNTKYRYLRFKKP